MADSPKHDWKTLAEMVTREQDPAKLLKIVTELNAALLERERAIKNPCPRVLVVDDDASVGQTLVPILQNRGYQAEFVDNVASALGTIKHGAFDALVCDLNIAEGGDGFKVVAAMREIYPRSVIILLTGYPAFQTAIEGLRHAVDDYLVKPADHDTVLRILDERIRVNHVRHV